MAKQPGIGSIWARKNGDEFEVVVALYAKRECLLRALGTGRKHWVTYPGLTSKYQWLRDPAPGQLDLEEDVRADERVRVLRWLMVEANNHQYDGEGVDDYGVHPSQTLQEAAKWLSETLMALRDDATGNTLELWSQAFPKGDPSPQEIPEL